MRYPLPSLPPPPGGCSVSLSLPGPGALDAVVSHGQVSGLYHLRYHECLPASHHSLSCHSADKFLSRLPSVPSLYSSFYSETQPSVQSHSYLPSPSSHSSIILHSLRGTRTPSVTISDTIRPDSSLQYKLIIHFKRDMRYEL